MKALLDKAVALYKQYPSRVNGTVASAVVAIGTLVGVGFDHDTVLKLVAVLLPLVAAEATHHKVTPVS